MYDVRGDFLGPPHGTTHRGSRYKDLIYLKGTKYDNIGYKMKLNR